jgi:hypothetical protein
MYILGGNGEVRNTEIDFYYGYNNNKDAKGAVENQPL